MSTMIYGHPVSTYRTEVGRVEDDGVIYKDPIKKYGYEVGCVKNNIVYSTPFARQGEEIGCVENGIIYNYFKPRQGNEIGCVQNGVVYPTPFARSGQGIAHVVGSNPQAAAAAYLLLLKNVTPNTSNNTRTSSSTGSSGGGSSYSGGGGGSSGGGGGSGGSGGGGGGGGCIPFSWIAIAAGVIFLLYQAGKGAVHAFTMFPSALITLISIIVCAFNPVMKDKSLDPTPEFKQTQQYQQISGEALKKALMYSIIPALLWIPAFIETPHFAIFFFAVVILLCGVAIYHKVLVKKMIKEQRETPPTIKTTAREVPPKQTPPKTNQTAQTNPEPYCYVKCPKCGRRNRVPKGKGTLELTCGNKECKHVFRANT